MAHEPDPSDVGGATPGAAPVVDRAPEALDTGPTSPLSRAERRAARRAAEGPKPPSEIPAQLRSLITASHPRQALVMGLALGVLALVSGRELKEAFVAGLAVLLVQAVLGLDNDAVDQERDRAAAVPGKPIAEGRLPAGNATFVALCLALVAVPISLLNGTVAALFLLGTLLSGLAYDRWLRPTPLSWLPWAVGFGLLPGFLSYGGWAGGSHGSAPTWTMSALSALLGVGVHFLVALPDLVADNKSGVRHLPLRLALRVGAPRLLVLSGAYTGLVVIGLVLAALTTGLRQ